MNEMYLGSAICDVAAAGELLLPLRFFETARARCIDGYLLIGLHEESPCLVAFDRVYVLHRQFDIAERFDKSPGGFHDHHRLRRMYGFVDEAPLSPDGVLQLPPLMRERGGIGSAALLVASGARFEIWDLDDVLAHGPSDLVTVATLLGKIKREDSDDTGVPLARPCTGAHHIAQPAICLQPLPPVSPRHDPVDRRGIG